MTVIDFAKEYPIERERVFRVLSSCKNLEQVEIAINYFDALKQKWSSVSDNNSTIKLMINVDEEVFALKLKEVSLVFS